MHPSCTEAVMAGALRQWRPRVAAGEATSIWAGEGALTRVRDGAPERRWRPCGWYL